MNKYDEMCSDAPEITDPADFEENVFDEDMIFEWAQKNTGGGLPGVSAVAFASWLDSAWNDFGVQDEILTNEDVLKDARDFWVGKI